MLQAKAKDAERVTVTITIIHYALRYSGQGQAEQGRARKVTNVRSKRVFYPFLPIFTKTKTNLLLQRSSRDRVHDNFLTNSQPHYH